MEVAVDLETGGLQILRAVSAHDLGRLINPLLAEGQVRGAFAQGLGFTICEQFILEDGKVINDSLMDYLLPTALDIPRSLRIAFVESNELSGPFGAKGLGQTGTLAVAPAVANAIREAIGVRFTALPFTAERVWKGLQGKDELSERKGGS
jgi:xanthine dehydrogenase molybdenum-binding subunit